VAVVVLGDCGVDASQLVGGLAKCKAVGRIEGLEVFPAVDLCHGFVAGIETRFGSFVYDE